MWARKAARSDRRELLRHRAAISAPTSWISASLSDISRPMAEGTHSWIEPTAFHALALKATARGEHPRAREAITLLLDRQLPSGGCNYGNTAVLGQMLRPHVQPTGIALLALAREQDQGKRFAKSVAWLRKALSTETTPTSVA